MFKFLGGTFLVIGAVIGGGILAIPIVSINLGFLTTSIFIILAWMIMTKTGLYVLDLCLSCPERYNSYYSIVGNYLGNKIQFLTIILLLGLLYFSLSSYISGCASIIMSHLTISSPGTSYFYISLAYTFLFGSLVVISAKIIVRLNVFLVMMKVGLLLLIIIISSSNYYSIPIGKIVIPQTEAFSVLMLIINAFGYQFIIPSLVSYYGHEYKNKFRWMLILSTTTVLCLYLAWLFAIYSIIPLEGEHGLQAIYQSKNQLLSFNESLVFYLHSGIAIFILSIFEGVALFGSFFCVSLGIFDFLSDVFKSNNRVLIGILTFTPPLLITLVSENMYVHALAIGGYIAVVFEIIIPIFAWRRLRTIGTLREC